METRNRRRSNVRVVAYPARNNVFKKHMEIDSSVEHSALQTNSNLKHHNQTDTLVYSKMRKKQSGCNKWLINPDNKYKNWWDLIIIVFSVWNAVLVPYTSAYGSIDNIVVSIIDRFVDVCFIIDIFINFRTMYRDSRTDELVQNWKKITFRYVFYGRFWIDLLASLPVEVLELVLGSNAQFIRLIKLIRLLRLGRMITFMRANRQFKFGMKIVQLIFLLLLSIHWINCSWYYIVVREKDWFPSKDLDFKETIVF